MGSVQELRRERRAPARQAKDPEAIATEKLAKAIDRAVERLGPAADAIVSFDHRLDALCTWLKQRLPWALALAPFVLAFTGGAGAQIGTMLGAFFKAYNQ